MGSFSCSEVNLINRRLIVVVEKVEVASCLLVEVSCCDVVWLKTGVADYLIGTCSLIHLQKVSGTSDSVDVAIGTECTSIK